MQRCALQGLDMDIDFVVEDTKSIAESIEIILEERSESALQGSCESEVVMRSPELDPQVQSRGEVSVATQRDHGIRSAAIECSSSFVPRRYLRPMSWQSLESAR